MWSVYSLKRGFQDLLRPLVRRAAALGVTPNMLTLTTILVCVLFGVWLWRGSGDPARFLWLPLLLFVRMALNAMDGMLAKEFAMSSRLGAALNEVGDLIADVALYLPFGLVAGIRLDWLFAFLALGFFVELLGYWGEVRQGKRRNEGPLGKSDRALWMGLLSALIALDWGGSRLWNSLLLLYCLLGLWTMINRGRAGGR